VIVGLHNELGYKVLKDIRPVLTEFHKKGVAFCAGNRPVFASHHFVHIDVDLESEETPLHVLLADVAALGQGRGWIHGIARQCSVRDE
jgi:hypothetical protein